MRGTNQDRGHHSDMMKVTKALIAGMRKYADQLERDCKTVMDGGTSRGPLGCCAGGQAITHLEIVDASTTRIINDDDTGTAQDIVSGEYVCQPLKFRIKVWDDMCCDDHDKWVETDFRDLFDIPFHEEHGLMQHIWDALTPFLEPMSYIHEKTGKKYTESDLNDAEAAHHYAQTFDK